MDGEQYDKLTDREKRIKVAECAGWKRTHFRTDAFWFMEHVSTVHVTDLPDYLNDLNAMHEAEKVLEPAQWRGFVCNIIDILLIDIALDRFELNDHFTFIHATAAQRAKAFVLTLSS